MNSNIINKDLQIRRIVDYLLNKYNENIIIKDFWDADLCAIGLSDKTEKYLIYISTFGLSIDRFNVVLEKIKENKENFLKVREFNDITLDKLEKTLVAHFKIK